MAGSTTPGGVESPAALFGPTSLGLGLAAAAGLCPWLFFGLFPVMLICGALAFAFGLSGVYSAQRGVGRMWMATAGTVLGVVGFAWPVVLLAGSGYY
ncbi:hypothetical protein [Streptomyces sp. L2]|uniref:hypothetical protein n=1 Tax=Streptomyces sp. L2 TaxID=2162665 RepID=UPI0010129F99|nr:hypothetical protein [Streptomyces sp. L2]